MIPVKFLACIVLSLASFAAAQDTSTAETRAAFQKAHVRLSYTESLSYCDR